MVDNEIIDDLAADIASWNSFFIVAPNEYADLANDFHNLLEEHLNIDSRMITEDRQKEFIDMMEEGDALLAISPQGTEGHVRATADMAFAKNVRVYAICSDLKSPLAFYARDVLVPDKEDFGQGTREILVKVFERLVPGVKDDFYNVNEAHPTGVPSGYEIRPAMPNAPSGNPAWKLLGCIIPIAVVIIVLIVIFGI